MNPLPILLVLGGGCSFFGKSFGVEGEAFRELILSIGMSGYQETLTGPSYRGQTVLTAVPHIGNTGWGDENDESARIQVVGYVVRDPTPRPSNWHNRRSLDAELADQGIVGIRDIDTRALTCHIHSLRATWVGISARELNPDRPRAKVLEQPVVVGASLCGEVSTPGAQIVPAVGERRFMMAAVNLGIEGITPVQMVGRGMEMHIPSTSTSLEEIATLEPDGIFLSNDPGDPATVDDPVTVLRQMLVAGTPHFGICFGNQLFRRALRFDTYKLKFGHRGINQPVLDRTIRKIEITSQDCGFAVDAPLDRVVDTEFGQASVSHISLNDDVVEGSGLRRSGKLVTFSVQHHPETAAGPYSTNHLFDRFVDLMRSRDAH